MFSISYSYWESISGIVENERPLESPVLIAILARSLPQPRRNVKTSEITKSAQSSQFL